MGVRGRFGVLGCGNMGTAIVRGLIESGTIPAEKVLVYDVEPARTAPVEALGAGCAACAADLARDSDILLLATKPQDMDAALESIGPGVRDDTLLLSIAAGISTGYILERLGEKTRVVRAMPNTPVLVGAGASGLAASESCTSEDRNTAMTLFSSIGVAVNVSEENMDVVTALSGSGPAYFFYLVECLVEAAAGLGLGREEAESLAGQTLYGAGKLLMESGESAATLRERVTSKGGTTAAALKQFGDHDFSGVIRAGLEAAAARSKELGK